MKICLVGTSNAVFADGYASVFSSKEEVELFNNYSLGYSSCFLFAFKSKEIDFSIYDFCVLDFSVNDGVNLKKGAVDAGVVFESLSDSVRHVLSFGCIPVLHVMPSCSLFQDGERVISDICRAVADKYRLPIFDCYDYLSFIQAEGVDVSSLFEDDMHLKRDVARKIGSYLVEGLRVLHFIKRSGLAHEFSEDGYAHSYYSVQELLGDSSDFSLIETKILKASIFKAQENTVIRFSNSGEQEIVGVGVDWANSIGKVELRGETSVSLNLNTFYSTGSSRPVFGIHPVLLPAKIKHELLIDLDKSNASIVSLGGFVLRSKQRFKVKSLLAQKFVISDAFIRRLPKLTSRDTKDCVFSKFYFDSLYGFYKRSSTPSGFYSIKILDSFFDFLIVDNKAPRVVVDFGRAECYTKLPALDLGSSLEEHRHDSNHLIFSDPGGYFLDPLDSGWYVGFSGCPVLDVLNFIISNVSGSLCSRPSVFLGRGNSSFAALRVFENYNDSSCLISDEKFTFLGNDIQKSLCLLEKCYTVAGFCDFDSIFESGVFLDLHRYKFLRHSGKPRVLQYQDDDHINLLIDECFSREFCN